MSQLIERYLAGEGLPCPVFDCHSHLGVSCDFPIQDGDADGILRTMDAGGIRGTIASSMYSMKGDIEGGNAGVAQMVAQHPDRFKGYITVNPHYPEMMERELVRYAETPGFVGVKVHQETSECPADDARWDPAYRFADERGWLVLSHVWGATEAERCRDTLERFPNIKLLAGHAGADMEGYKKVMALAKQYNNLYCDLTISQTTWGTVEWFVEEVGPEQVLYGTDMPFIEGRGAMGWTLFADIDDEAKRMVLGGNLLRLLGDNAPPWTEA